MSYKMAILKCMKLGIRLSGFGLLVKASSLIKASFLVGSQAIFFSGVNSAVPLVGALGGTGSSLILWIARIIVSGAMDAKLLALTVPGLCACLYWSINHWSIRLLVPIFCFIAFVVHPVGSAAWVYALYWLIPLALYFVPRKNIFITSLAATFTAHAVGSVLWLYTVSTSPALWFALIPVVIFERLCFASGTVIGYYAITASRHLIERASYTPTRVIETTSH